MLTTNLFVFVTILSYGFTNGQLDNVIFEIEPDFELHDDIWDDLDTKQTVDESPQKLLETLCNKYDLKVLDQDINCDNLKVIPKTLKLQEHRLIKRDTTDDNDNLEGSAEEPPSNPEPPKPDDSEAKPKEENKPEIVAAPSEATISEPVPEAPKNVDTEKVEEKKVNSDDHDKSLSVELQPPKEAEKPVQEPSVQDVQTIDTKEKDVQVTENAVKVTEKTPEIEESKTVMKEPTDPELSEPADKGQESEAKKTGRKSQEDFNSNQSGNALINSGGGNLIETDIKLTKMKTNESIKSVDEPKSGESSEKAGRKDNSLLIGLFVAVLVVGAAAFTYNFIKKRRAVTNAPRREENGPSKEPDVEEGREMKPLMSLEQRNNVEFKDEK